MKKVQSVPGFPDSCNYLCWAFEASNCGLSKSPRLHTKKSKASKELKEKNDLIGWWQSKWQSSWFFGRLDALDTHFRDRVSEYEQYKVGGIRVQLWDSHCFQSKQDSRKKFWWAFGTCICSIQGQIKPHSGYGVLGSIHFSRDLWRANGASFQGW